MNETVETCGKAYCEHYPDGLFVCAKCREESTIAHDRACALIAEAQADADHWKGECNALQRMVHEARAEIERKDKLIEQMREVIRGYRIEHKAWCGHDPDNAKKCTCGLSELIRAALLAAERGEHDA